MIPMSLTSFMNQVRQWDNRSNQWFVRHFYVLFFEMILIVAFVVFFILSLKNSVLKNVAIGSI